MLRTRFPSDSSSFYFPPPSGKCYAIKGRNSFAAAAKLKHRRNKTTSLISTVIVEYSRYLSARPHRCTQICNKDSGSFAISRLPLRTCSIHSRVYNKEQPLKRGKERSKRLLERRGKKRDKKNARTHYTDRIIQSFCCEYTTSCV